MRLLLSLFILVTLTGCSRHKSSSRGSYTPPPAPKIEYFKTCDRGTDLSNDRCDRNITQRTYWAGKRDFDVTFKKQIFGKTKAKVNVFYTYEFFPKSADDKNEKSIGTFRRGVAFYNPILKRNIGYLEDGFVSRVSHKAIDFIVTADSCSGRTAAHKKTMFYKRTGPDFHIAAKEESDGLEVILALPIVFIEAVLHSIDDVLSSKNVLDVLDQPIDLKPFRNSIENLKIVWGCSKNGDFTTEYVPDIQIHRAK